MKTSTFARNTQLDEIASLAAAGFLRLYSAPMAESPDVAVPRDAQLISEHRLSSPAFEGAFNGTIKAKPIADDPEARVSATAAWFRVTQSNGASVLWDGTVGERGSDMNFTRPNIQAKARVSISTLTITQPA